MSEITPTFVALPLASVSIGPRLRPVDADYVALLAASMAETGQHTPVDVGTAGDDGTHPLIAGAHRMAAAREAGLTSILARVHDLDADSRLLLEIDENLMRRGLSELDRAVFLAERKAVYERLNPQTRHGGKRRGDQGEEDFHLIPRQESFAAATAVKLGVSRRQVTTYLARARLAARVPELREALSRSRWADNGAVLDELARVEADADLRALITALLREKPPASIRAAQLELGLIRDSERSPDDTQFARLLDLWRPTKTGAAARERFLRHLVADAGTAAKLRALLADDEDGGAPEERQKRVVAALRRQDAA